MKLTPSQILLALEDDLNSWQAPTKFLISIASEPFEVLELLAQTSQQIRLILLWAGDEAIYDGNQALGIVNTRIEVTISHATGLSIKPGENLHRPSINGRPSLVGLLSSVRSRIRSLHYPADETTSEFLEYKGTDPVITPEGFRLDAYMLRFEIQAALSEEEPREAIIQ